MQRGQYDQFKSAASRAAGILLEALKHEKMPVTVVHHNDADGLCSAASLSRVFSLLSIEHTLLPLEKIHELILSRIHAKHRGCIIYADLGGQSSVLIGEYSRSSGMRLVIILDHHLPGGEVPDNVIHLNPENFGISGDNEISGAAVSALFGGELLGLAGVQNREAELAVFGILGAFGDRQLHGGSLRGVNKMLFKEAGRQGLIREAGAGTVIPAFGCREPAELVEILDRLGSIGFYSGEAQKGIQFLLGRDQQEAVEAASRMGEMKKRLFAIEMGRIGNSTGSFEVFDRASAGWGESSHFQWIDVRERFHPMGVKAIGLFLEELIKKEIAGTDKYLIGFQHFPESQPGIGSLGVLLTKVSARVPEMLREKIEGGEWPDFMHLIPGAVNAVGGIADGCHRFSGAALIRRGDEQDFMKTLEGSFE